MDLVTVLLYPLGFDLASSPLGTRPPLAPNALPAIGIDDLLPGSDDDNDDGRTDSHTKSSRIIGPTSSDDAWAFGNCHPPSFHENVKRSTRFVTAVPAAQVLLKIENILELCRLDKRHTAIGPILRVNLNWSDFKLEAYGTEIFGSPLFSLQLYEFSSLNSSAQYLSASSSNIWTDVNLYGRSPALSMSPMSIMDETPSKSMHQDLFLVEFVRGRQIEIFAFKRFYDWLRQSLSQLIKKDCVSGVIEQAVSPK